MACAVREWLIMSLSLQANGVGYTRLTCVNQTAEEDYLYHGSVREALHISADAPRWRPCACVVGFVLTVN